MYVFQEGSLPGNARKKMSFILYSDHTPPPQLTVSVPAPEKAIQFTEEPGVPGRGRCGFISLNPLARSPSVEQVCQTFPVTTKHEHAFQVPQARQVLFWQDRVCLSGAICARAECWAVEFF